MKKQESPEYYCALQYNAKTQGSRPETSLSKNELILLQNSTT